ncbi:MAG TPA: helix-turn-helix transcriptional regulator [Vineibacter sp.]|nr:helix-turn-helix transcriptional regulator [Vineibacter sp.]
MMQAGTASDTIRTVYGAVLDRLDVGVILLDGMGRPTFINGRAARIVADNDGFGADRAGVTASSPAETRALRAAIAATASVSAGVAVTTAPTRPPENAAPNRLYLERPSGLTPLVVTVIALDGLDGGSARESPRAALFVVDPATPVRIDTRGLGAAYGLTPREASIAALLSRGADLVQAARALGIGVSSAREYLKRALDKTGTRRQANLVRLVLRSFAVSHC